MNPRRSALLLALGLLALGTRPLAAQAPPLDAAARGALIDSVLARLEASYFDSSAVPEMARLLREHEARGHYDALSDGQAFADTLTAHLRRVRDDGHLAVWFSADPLPPDRPPSQRPTPEEVADYRVHARRVNYGFEEVRRLDGNVGYLNLRWFAEADEESGRVATAAMGLLAHADAVIIDLRQNGGGGWGMLELLASYFFERQVHLRDLAWREALDGRRDVTDQAWTLPYVPGPRLTAQPVFILTSPQTFSAAEAFAYALQQRGRARVVGEASGGGAHPNAARPVSEHFVVSVPIGETIDPVHGGSWEGVGVEPDVAVAAGEALRAAHALALRALLERATAADHRSELEAALSAIKTP